MGKLTDRSARGKLIAGMHADGAGLYLAVAGSGSRSWIFRGTVKGQTTQSGSPYRCEIGIGSVADVTLADARSEADRLRKICRAGENPLDQRKRERWTFEEAARAFHEQQQSHWVPGHAKRWLSALETYVFPTIGRRHVENIRRGDVLEVLMPIWGAKHETARRLKQNIGQVIEYCIDLGMFQEANPCMGRFKSLPTAKKEPQHRASLSWRELPALWTELDGRDGISAACLQFIILTAARSGEARGALWSEIDLSNRTWRIPAERMKARKGHRVPLSSATLSILKKVEGLDPILVFPSVQRAETGAAKPMSDMVFKALMVRMGRNGFTTHGFRSTFRDWCSESARADREIAEAALAHSLGNKVEQAYARSDLFERRKALMDTWAAYVTGATNQVVQMVRA